MNLHCFAAGLRERVSVSMSSRARSLSRVSRRQTLGEEQKIRGTPPIFVSVDSNGVSNYVSPLK